MRIQTRMAIGTRWTPWVIAILAWFAVSCTGTESPPSEDLGPRAATADRDFDRASLNDIYGQVLQFADSRGRVRYSDLKSDRASLDQFVSQLRRLGRETYESWPTPARIAFWINAYNALTLRAVIDHYPIRSSFLASLRFPSNSIRQIPGVWDEWTFEVMGRTLTLDGIEHGILRKQFTEPRIHMALVCAAVGCPPLRAEPYSGEDLDAQLEDQTRRFLADPTKFRVDRKDHIVLLSPIFEWYGEDFVGRYTPASGFSHHDAQIAAVLNFIGLHVSPELRSYLAKGDYDVRYLGYDWSLNERDHG